MTFKQKVWPSLCLLSSSIACMSYANTTPTSEIPEFRHFRLDESINPCNDFYQYTCNKEIQGFKLRDDRSVHTFSFGDLSEKLLEKKKKFLLELTQSKKQVSPRINQLKNSYIACMNTSSTALEEVKLVKEKKNLLQKFKDKAQLLKYLSEQIEGTESSLVGFSKDVHLTKPDFYDISLIPLTFRLPEKTYYTQEPLMADYEKIVALFFETIGEKEPEKKAKLVVNFEKEAASVFPLARELRQVFVDDTYMEREEFKKLYPLFALDRFLNMIPKHTGVRNLFPKSMNFLHNYISNASIDDLRTLLLYQELSSTLEFAYPKYFNEKFEFNRKYLGGPEKLPDIQERCTKMVMNRFGMELDAELLPKLFPRFPEEKVVSLVKDVREEILKSIKTNTWLSDKAREKAYEKIEKAELLLVKPKTEKQWNFLPITKYSNKENIRNSKRYRKVAIDQDLKDLQGPRDKTIWMMSPLTVNAYYSPSENLFALPIGILQPPFFDPEGSREKNLGGIGTVIGHELGHAIDDKCSLFDASGQKNDWMTMGDRSNFSKLAAPLVEQFNKAGLDGNLTLGENIGDLVGITFAYRAAFPQEKGSDEKKKEFFIQQGRIWCGVIRPKYAELRAKTDPHADYKSRVNEQLKHQKGFQDAFSCKKNDPMVLPDKKRVVIW